MLHFLKGLIIVTILAAIILPGIGYFLSSKITLLVNQWIANISPYVRVSYGKIDIDPRGVITLHDATVGIKYGQQPKLKIQRAYLRFPELYNLYLLAIKGDFSAAPDSLAIELQGMNLFFLENSELAEHFAFRNDTLSASLPSVCGKTLLFGPRQLQSMGYQPSTLMNLGMQYQFHAFSQSLDVLFETEVQGLGFVTLGMSIGPVKHLDWEVPGNQDLRLKQLTFLYQDDGYINRKIQYCSKQSGVSPEAYIAREASQNDRYYADVWGVTPGASTKDAYREFLHKPQTVSINLEFQSPFLLNHQYWDSQIPAVRHLYISVNNKEIIDPELNLNPVGLSGKIDDLFAVLNPPERLNPGNENTTTTDGMLLKQKAPPTEEINQRAVYTGQHLKYHSVELTALSENEHRQVRITLKNGRQYEGFLKGLNTEVLQLKSIQSGGEVVRPIQLESITLLEVMM